MLTSRPGMQHYMRKTVTQNEHGQTTNVQYKLYARRRQTRRVVAAARDRVDDSRRLLTGTSAEAAAGGVKGPARSTAAPLRRREDRCRSVGTVVGCEPWNRPHMNGASAPTPRSCGRA